MDSLSKTFSASHPKDDPGKGGPSSWNRREKFGSEHLQIVPVPPEELPEEMRSVLESVCRDSYL
jgi:hypothetical protein